MKKLLIILIALTATSCMTPNYVNRQQKQRVKESLKYSYPERATRPHEKWIVKFQ